MERHAFLLQGSRQTDGNSASLRFAAQQARRPRPHGCFAVSPHFAVSPLQSHTEVPVVSRCGAAPASAPNPNTLQKAQRLSFLGKHITTVRFPDFLIFITGSAFLSMHLRPSLSSVLLGIYSFYSIRQRIRR